MLEQKRKKITQDVISSFLEGNDPMEHIVHIDYSYKDNFVTVYYRDELDRKCAVKEPFYPFLWAKRKTCVELCGGNREEIKRLLRKYNISVKLLDTKSEDGMLCKEMEDGFIFMFQAREPMSNSYFHKFFKECGKPVYKKEKLDKSGNIIKEPSYQNEYLCVTPQEQYMIETGRRFFKGYEDYDELLRMVFDLETGGLNPQTDRIEQFGIRFNRPVMLDGKMQPFERIFSVTGNSKEEKDICELATIRTAIQIIYTFDPDIITAHNGENFDWWFIMERCKILGTTLEELSKPFFNGDFIRKNTRETVLKLGGEVETFNQTIVPGRIVTDSLHAVRRAQAIDSNMLLANLKYVTKYSKMNKPNRVYVPGDKISEIWNDLRLIYAHNDKNGDWYIVDEKHPLKGNYELKTGKYIVERYLLDDLWECDKVEHRYNMPNFLICKMLPVPFQKCCTMGTAGQWKSVMLAWSYENNLAIPNFGEKKRFTGGLSRLLKVGYVPNVIKLDYNSLYPSIIITWAIANNKDITKVMLYLLEHVLTQREKYKGLKKKAGKLFSKLKEELELFKGNLKEKEEKENEARKAESDESANDKKQLPLKIFGNSYFGSFGAPDVFPWASTKCAEQTTCTGRQSLRLMIYHFNNLGYVPIVGDTDGFNFQLPDVFRYTKENPYIGKGLNRNVKEGKEYTDYEADVAEFNDLYMRKKMGLGIDEVVNATINFSRKNYADFFPENPEPGDVKMVGNTIKSKKMPEYISKFLSKGIRLLLRNEGQKFLDSYYAYVEKIYNLQIPLKDIASKGKVKKTLEEYVEDCNTITKAGNPKSRQAWMELALKENLKVNLGETLYYINTGTSKSHSDVKKITHYYVPNEKGEKVDIIKTIEKDYKQYKKECTEQNVPKEKILKKNDFIHSRYHNLNKEYEIVLNSRLLPREMIDSEEDFYCEGDFEYNVAKYIDQFNKRITPLLVCFNPEIRDKILIDNPSKRPYFTEEEAKLTNGFPYKAGDQDTFEQLMTMEDKEIIFWMNNPDLEIPFLKECNMDWEEIKNGYLKRLEEEKSLGIDLVKEKYQAVIEKMREIDLEKFMNGELPSELSKIVQLDPLTANFVSRKYPDIVIGNINDFLDNNVLEDSEE